MFRRKRISGYKVFDPNWRCRDFQYEVGLTYHAPGRARCCVRGFHFCRRLIDCFSYYDFDLKNKVAEVEAFGYIDERGDKVCASDITIVRELSWLEVLQTLNVGDFNVGKGNLGDYNTGRYNVGNKNTGDYNAGHTNTGDYNTGFYNTGSYNSGDSNVGSFNAGDYNTGDYNVGDYNTGDYNVGDYNTGDYNVGRYNTGAFNTVESEIMLFNKPSGWTFERWFNSVARNIMSDIPSDCLEWVEVQDMTMIEVRNHPECEIAGGYLRSISQEELYIRRQKWWNGLSDGDRKIVMDLPNFDPVIFRRCTGIEVW